jgi:hypothetical protein
MFFEEFFGQILLKEKGLKFFSHIPNWQNVRVLED